MATKIVTKNSSTASAVPTASDLVQGELAVNVADKRLFTEDNGGSIVELGTNPSTIDINAGTVDGAVIGGTTPAAITGSTVTSTGNIVVTGTVDGRDVATDGTKLDGIEASADVTDTTNVTAAGALMDSEVTNLAQVKAFDSSDYATAAQGTTADAALPKAGGALTGAVTTNSTFDGRDVAADGTKLDGIEASADVTDTTNVVASLTAGSNITIAADGTIASTSSGGGETLQETLVIGNTTTTDTKIQFRDTGLYINSSADGQLDIVADTEVQIDATTVDVNGILDVSGNIVAGGTVDGRDVATDGTKLDGIEAGADVTDTANVTAAGAVMDSELTSEASVKALNQGVATTDSPAFAGLTVDTDTLYVDSTNNRVGIGTTSPTSNLEVSDSTQATGATLSVTNSHEGSWASGDKIGSIDFRVDDASAAEKVRAKVHAESGTTGTFPSDSNLVFSTTSANTLSEAMRIDYTGRVAVGTTSTTSGIFTIEGGQTSLPSLRISKDASTGPIFSAGNVAGTDSNFTITTYDGTTKLDALSPANGSGQNITFRRGSSGETMRCTSNGTVGIGTTAPAAALHVVGSIVATGNITAYYSDERLKNLIGTIPNALDKVSQLNGYYYTPNDTAKGLGVESKGVEVGVSAQQIETVLPEIIADSVVGTGYKTVMYEKITPLLIEAIKELSDKVDAIETKLKNLEK